MLLRQFFSTTTCKCKKIIPNKLKGKSVSSQNWLTRQLSDPYVEKAKIMNYRCRSAFKLLEIDDKFNILKPGITVVDCGASPGSWSQIAAKRVNSFSNLDNAGFILAIDKQLIYPIEGVTMLSNMDFTKPETQELIKETLQGKEVNVVLSDMAPSATGIRDLDNENMMTLCYNVLRFAVQVSGTGGALLLKLWQCGEAKTLEENMLKFYKSVKFVKPHASRVDSAEIFLLGREFKGLVKNS